MRIRISNEHERLQRGQSRVKSRSLAVLCLAVISLAACTLGPDYKRPEVPLPTSWRTEPASADDVVNTAWWEAFHDPELSKLIRTAIDANKDLRIATLRIDQYDSRLEISRAANYPKVVGEATPNRERRTQERANGLAPGAPPTLDLFELNATFGWELDLWGRVRRSNEAARAELLSAEDARRAVMLTVVSSVATSYVQLVALDQQLALAKQTLKNRKDALALAELKYLGGSANLLAVAQARSVVEEVEASLPPLEAQIATVENALSSLLGRNPGPIERRAMSALALPAVPQGIPSDVLTRRPDVLAAEQDLVAANANIGVAKTLYFPTLSLTAAAGLTSAQLKFIGAKTARTGEIGANVLGTIFSGGRIEGQIRETEAIQRQMVVRFEQSVQTALQEVDNALVLQSKSRERDVALDRRVTSLKDVVRLARLRYEGGQSSYFEVLEAEFQLYAAQNQQQQSQRDTYVALISVYKAMGGGWMVEQDKLRAPTNQATDAMASAETAAEMKK